MNRFTVLEANSESIKIWDGKSKDEWLKPAWTQLFGDFSEFKPDDKVCLVIRKLEEPATEVAGS